MEARTIPGYTYGTGESARSPLSDEELEQLKATVLFGPEDERWLRQAGEILDDQVEDVLDVWYGFVGDHSFLVHYFSDEQGEPIPEYLERVRARFGQWIRDTCAARYDRAWLDYQHEIGLRHTSAKKDRTDGVSSGADQIHLRYVIGFIVPISATMRPFLAKKGHSAEEVEKMYEAWHKAVVLHVALWSVPYTDA